ncbi:EAL domain-containing protein [Thiomicrorhabdus sediminis]|uniref:EAL domain-containing protein n=1 Tax=Thiomicrorhabdus sediminis TaxID=2580412 RepID=UPI00143DB2A5|nr:EAL domain-containing protein [Thiomicrorhabdus sediminis]
MNVWYVGKNPDLGFVPPNEFIKVAEDIGLMPELGHYITQTSLRQMAELQQQLQQEFQVSINISLKQFSQPYFFEEFIKVAEKSGVKLTNITIEVTESLFIEDLNFILGILHNFRKKGVSISLDDFGTGFSSLSLLRQLPIQELKIDKAFVDDILTDDKDATLINNIIQIANDLGMYTVAEGVETLEQKKKLTSYGCILYQGYYFAKPMGINDLKNFIRDIGNSNINNSENNA